VSGVGLALAAALVGAYGVHLLWTGVALGWRGVGVGPRAVARRGRGDGVRALLRRLGLEEVSAAELAAVMVVLFGVGAGLAWALFGGVLPPLAAGLFAATFPVAAARARRQRRWAEAREAWPRMIEEIRLLTSTVGLSIPHALFQAGARAPEVMRPAFEDARREWLISTDLERTAALLKSRLADATADATLETLLVAHQVGGSDVDRRLAALVEDRAQDLQGRKDARAKQAGVRFARRFVLIVPLGMALVGLSIGEGRAAYQAPGGQAAVAVGLVLLAACWLWAGRLLRLPDPERVFPGSNRSTSPAQRARSASQQVPG
jgi:tight adherence protein B